MKKSNQSFTRIYLIYSKDSTLVQPKKKKIFFPNFKLPALHTYTGRFLGEELKAGDVPETRSGWPQRTNWH
jgi:hypothetical protein